MSFKKFNVEQLDRVIKAEADNKLKENVYVMGHDPESLVSIDFGPIIGNLMMNISMKEKP